jgi:hypothetical protein
VEQGDLAFVVNALLAGFDAVDADPKAGFDIMAFAKIHELFGIATEGIECDPELLRHYSFGNFTVGNARDDEGTRARAAFARRLGDASDIVKNEKLPIPEEFVTAVNTLAEWFIALD